MKRVISIWFPNCPIQRRLASAPSANGRALVVHAPSQGKTRVIACCRAARRRGVRPGMLLTEAQSRWPTAAENLVRFKPHDPQEFSELLERLSSRLGERAVSRPELQLDAQLEFACRYEPWLEVELAPLRRPSASRLHG